MKSSANALLKYLVAVLLFASVIMMGIAFKTATMDFKLDKVWFGKDWYWMPCFNVFNRFVSLKF